MVEEKIKEGYKRKEVGVIPEDWEKTRLGEITSINTGKKNNQDKSDDGIYPFYVRSQDVERINSFSYDGEAILIPGEGRIGSVYHYINGKFDYHQRVYKISDFNNVLGKYIYYYMKEFFYKHAMENSVKATVDSLRLPTFENFIINHPNNKKEQKAIAEVLSDTDNLITTLQKLIDKKEKIKKGAMKKLLTGKERLPGFNGEWEEKEVFRLGEIYTGGTPSTKVEEYWNGNIPWVTPTDINTGKNINFTERYITDLGLNKLNELSPNTILITCIASIGKNAILRRKGACNQQINAIIPNHKNDSNFIYYLMEENKNYLLSKAGITATKIISKKIFENLRFKIPELKEQKAIAQILSDMDLEIEALNKKLEKYKKIKQGMMEELLTGRIRLV
jgi:type I restriction enzyme S subunit